MKEILAILLVFAFLIGAPVALIVWNDNNSIADQKADCRARGGEPAVTYSTRVICFAPGILR